jgi:hypothetical protein
MLNSFAKKWTGGKCHMRPLIGIDLQAQPLAIALISSVASLAGYAVFCNFSADVSAATEAMAAGAILTMIADTMVARGF